MKDLCRITVTVKCAYFLKVSLNNYAAWMEVDTKDLWCLHGSLFFQPLNLIHTVGVI